MISIVASPHHPASVSQRNSFCGNSLWCSRLYFWFFFITNVKATLVLVSVLLSCLIRIQRRDFIGAVGGLEGLVPTPTFVLGNNNICIDKKPQLRPPLAFLWVEQLQLPLLSILTYEWYTISLNLHNNARLQRGKIPSSTRVQPLKEALLKTAWCS